MAEPFNPDKYLQTFDPDKYLGARTKQGEQPPDPAQDNSTLAQINRAIDPGPFLKGTLQGVLGIPEAIYQWGEQAGLPRVPEAVRAPLRKLRDDADKTWGGVAGETVGNILGFAGGGEVADALGLASKVPSVVSRIASSPITQSVIAQPTKAKDLPDFLTQKAEDAGLGWLFNRLFLKRPTQQAAHDITADANKTAIEKHAADVAATKQANEAAQAAHQQTVATEQEQHKALSEAQEQFHQGERAKVDAATQALNQRTERALQQRSTQLQTRGDVPTNTTAQWWRRTGQMVGEDIPASAAPETGARVQKAVGDRLNEITDRMHLDPADESLTDSLNEIRRTTSNALQEHNKGGFFAQKEATPLERIVMDKSGTMLPRTTTAEPPPPTGMWADQVLDKLKKGPLTGRDLTNYIRDLGNKANQLATRARAIAPGAPERTDLELQATALRQVQDTIIGHAAGSPEDKLALEQARKAYMMWGIGDDAAKASRNGIATPAQLVTAMTKRLGEARFKQALIDPSSPFHETATWLQSQVGAHTVRIPSASDVRARQGKPPEKLPARPPPIPKPAARTAPTPRPEPIAPTLPEPPPAPRRPRRDYLRAGEHAAAAALLAPHASPFAVWQGVRAIDALRGGRGGGTEGSLEAFIRRALTREPKRAGRVGRATAATAADRAQRTVPRDLRKAAEDVAAEGARVAEPYLNYRWGSGQ